MTTYHICIPIRKGIDELKKGRNYLDCTPGQALKLYTDYEAAGKEYYTGCNKEDSTGRCKGHPDKRNAKKKLPHQDKA